MYGYRSVQVADVDFEFHGPDVEDALRDAAENAAQGFGPYNDNDDALIESLDAALVERRKEIENERDEKEDEIRDLEEKIEQLRGEIDDLTDKLDEVESVDEADIRRIVTEVFEEFADEEEEDEG